jgi:hypothetical protein
VSLCRRMRVVQSGELKATAGWLFRWAVLTTWCVQSSFDCGPLGHGICAHPQGTTKTKRGRANGELVNGNSLEAYAHAMLDSGG